MSRNGLAKAITRVAVTFLLLSIQVTNAGAVAPGRMTAIDLPARRTSPFSYSGCGGVFGVPSSNKEYEQRVIDLVNSERTQRGLPPLKQVSSLTEAARYHATDMDQDNYFRHNSYDSIQSGLVFVCGWSQRIESYYSSAPWLGENIGLGSSLPEDIVNDWMKSQDHRDNILNTEYREMGVGYRLNETTGMAFWVQDFGQRPGHFPVIINNEAAETNSRNVSLYIYGAGSWDQIRLRNDNDEWTEWQAHQSHLNWALRNETGYRTVCVEMREGDQNSRSCDTIFLRNEIVLGNLPSSISFTYSIEEQRFFDEPRPLTPLNIGGTLPLTWALTQEGEWYTATPPTGTTPESFWITCTECETQVVSTYAGAITVTVTDPVSTENGSQQISLTLKVIESAFAALCLPIILRD
ncbi:MAG: CAP domain-containing protein [Anaerolineae bacterium]|nr:CAP domain-containing protein [Anaerolineae bacterium]